MGKVQIIDHGWNRLTKEFKRMDNSVTKVGLNKGKGAVSAPGNVGTSGKSPDDMAMIGTVHEFGSDKINVPARPWLRPAFDNNLSKLKNIVTKEYDRILINRSTVKKSLSDIGEFMVKMTKKSIEDVKSPPLKIRVGGDPLIWSGHLRDSQTHVESIKMSGGKS